MLAFSCIFHSNLPAGQYLSQPCNDVTFLSTCSCLSFICPTGWHRVCEIEFSHMGKSSEKCNLVCNNFQHC